MRHFYYYFFIIITFFPILYFILEIYSRITIRALAGKNRGGFGRGEERNNTGSEATPFKLFERELMKM